MKGFVTLLYNLSEEKSVFRILSNTISEQKYLWNPDYNHVPISILDDQISVGSMLHFWLYNFSTSDFSTLMRDFQRVFERRCPNLHVQFPLDHSDPLLPDGHRSWQIAPYLGNAGTWNYSQPSFCHVLRILVRFWLINVLKRHGHSNYNKKEKNCIGVQSLMVMPSKLWRFEWSERGIWSWVS